ncbi:MAG: hypothetical protein GF409_05800 [Candidatus Omnitrophica bacterium]|nr:hypothetical protein [Candidatus Omnitrophota bacterium]
MEASLFIARVVGPWFVVAGAGMLANRRFYQRVMEDFPRNSALILLNGMMALTFGIVVLLFHNKWTADWRVLVTIFGWGGVIKGVWMTVFPETVSVFTSYYSRNRSLLAVHAVIALILGGFLLYMGYIAG